MRQTRRAAQRRGLVMGVVLLIGVVFGLSWWQHRARLTGTVTPVDNLILEIVAPSARLFSGLRHRLAAAPASTITTDVGLARVRALEEENAQLRALLALRNTLPGKALAAEVIGRNTAAPWEGYLQLGKGSADGVEPRMVALTPQGVIGQVVTVTAHTAEIFLLTDGSNPGGVGARTDRAGAVGVLKGYRNGLCRLEYLSSQADVKPGDKVFTSEYGQIYPKGLPLGTVTEVKQNTVLSTRFAIVQPAADPAQASIVALIK
ncbi:MAG TPA: rod shape-determining protein MreC [Armatimonadota bacterium]